MREFETEMTEVLISRGSDTILHPYAKKQDDKIRENNDASDTDTLTHRAAA